MRWPPVQIARQPGPEIHAGGFVATPIVRSVDIVIGRGRLHWAAPVGVRVSKEGRSATKIRIVNVTRLVQAALVLVVVIILILMRLRTMRKGRVRWMSRSAR